MTGYLKRGTLTNSQRSDCFRVFFGLSKILITTSASAGPRAFGLAPTPALFLVHPRELDVNARGQIVYKRTGHAPCVIHTNAYKSPSTLDFLLPRWSGLSWIPSNSTRLQRFLMRKMRGEQDANETKLPKWWSTTPLQRQAVPVEAKEAAFS